MFTFFERQAAKLFHHLPTTPALATFATKSSKKIELAGRPVAPFYAHASIGPKWLSYYVNTPSFLKNYASDSLKLIAEATFWCVTYGLDRELGAMSYEEIEGFNPAMEFFERTDRAKLVMKVYSHLENQNRQPHEIRFALSEAAKCIYLHYHPKEELQESAELGPRLS
jgi:hypothetical protein